MELKMPYHIGCSSWKVPGRIGSFYTKKVRPENMLAQYASVFNTVEYNANMVQLPLAEDLQQWKETTPDGFKFCVRFPEEITHKLLLEDVENKALAFVDLFDGVRKKLGPIRIQLPTSFEPAMLPRLEKLLVKLPRTFNYAVETQHPNFFDRGNTEHDLEQLLKSYGVDRVITDTRKLYSTKVRSPDILEAQNNTPNLPVRFNATGSRPMVRYLGTNDILNNEVYLTEWAIVVADWIKDGLHPYVIISTPNLVSEPTLSTHFHKLLVNLIKIAPLEEWPIHRKSQLGLF